MRGRRLPDAIHVRTDDMAPGDYVRWLAATFDGSERWLFRTPNGILGQVSSNFHTFTLHDDETLTVAPSIAVDAGVPDWKWHGYLERGMWREA